MLILPVMLACSLGLAGDPPSPPAEAREWSFFHEDVMGTSLELRVRADGEAAARGAEARVLAEIDRLSRVFSSYDDSSELRRWLAGPSGPVRLSPELRAMLAACDGWRERSGGAFDVRAEVFSRIWAAAERRGSPPSAAELAAGRATLGRPAWRLDPDAGTAERPADVPISLNAIAKGHIVGRAAAAGLAAGAGAGVHGLVMNVGGDLRAMGEIEAKVGVVAPWNDSEGADPLTVLSVRDRAVATSGRSQRGFRIGGRWYSHILDPRTGEPAREAAAATVVAPRSDDADALATACCVLPPEDGLRLVAGVPGAECLIVDRDGAAVRSPGFSRYELAMASQEGEKPAAKEGARPKDGAAAAWNRDHELLIDFEINAPEGSGRRYRRPYVAIWVEDADGTVVRNLTLWVSMGGAGPFQWMPDLKRWYRAEQARKKIEKKDLFFTLARPTRPPGKYKVAWDGKDTQGRPVPRGEYTILIDAVREHGTYQHLQKKVELGDAPFREELKGDVEIKSATIEYRRKDAAKPAR
ncbi:Thiamine biosynthesis lipoprotein ApbE precursor [Aquisphaera giovannonii]|uniref:FAD:protein FMN transferase n=1 Tax=Aquisphaera giovannonii TaxID=406548 RepID=A0A5B9W5T6_9BACT|nr:DUF2271 domain-containing protein [Aquisphaera giovannonii]QEH36036.1 Thiamine biosynthesis lipoprotein ApbE precursor [Aquisphaera giovannonii]